MDAALFASAFLAFGFDAFQSVGPMIKENPMLERRSPKRILTDEMYARIPAMVQAGMSKKQIAGEFGCAENTLAVQCSRRRISLRKNRILKPLRRYLGVVKVQLQDETLQKLRSHALSKGMNDAQLVGNLLEVIVKDNLFDAVLDDAPSEGASRCMISQARR